MSDLEKKVLDQIERRRLAPRPYVYFLAKRSVFWTLAALSIILGAVSVAVLIFAGTDYFATGGRGLDDMPLDDVFEYLPVVWLGILSMFVASAYYALRQTRRGYSYNAVSLFCVALTISILLGCLLHMADAGRRTHAFLLRRLPIYEALTRPMDKSLADPDKGWLAGTSLGFDGKSTLTIKDFNGRTWTVDVSNAKVILDGPLGSQEDVSIKGQRTGPATFSAQSIEDWD